MKDLSKPQATWLEVGEESEAQRIDNFLLRRLKGVPKSHVYRVLRSGEVRVNSGRVKPEYRLKTGDRVRVPPVRVSEKKELKLKPLDLPVVYEDAALLVIDKPSGVAVHGGSGVSFGVIESLRAERPQAKMLELAHRLDRDTSGLLVVAKKRSALVELHRLLREGEVEKIYVAVVKGVPQKRSFEIREALVGGIAIDRTGSPLPQETVDLCRRAGDVGRVGREAAQRICQGDDRDTGGL